MKWDDTCAHYAHSYVCQNFNNYNYPFVWLWTIGMKSCIRGYVLYSYMFSSQNLPLPFFRGIAIVINNCIVENFPKRYFLEAKHDSIHDLELELLWRYYNEQNMKTKCRRLQHTKRWCWKSIQCTFTISCLYIWFWNLK